MNQEQIIRQISGKGIPLVGNDIDTDRIMPARFLKCVTFDELGNHVFEDDQAQAQGKHPFGLPEYQEATILVANGNFGCGSSREHAPQGLKRWGIKAIVAESFAEIFLGNCVSIGVPCVTAESDIINALQTQLQENPQLSLKIDLDSLTVSVGGVNYPIQMNPGARQQFMTGNWNILNLLLENIPQVQETAQKVPYLS